jgi:type I restriction enzyme R subunit
VERSGLLTTRCRCGGYEAAKEFSHLLVEKKVKKTATIEWTVKKMVRAKLRVLVMRVLRKAGYPPDKQPTAIETILKQAELLAED